MEAFAEDRPQLRLAMSERESVREGVEGADDTGMVAGEELITEAETMLPLERPELPRDQLHAARPLGRAAPVPDAPQLCLPAGPS